MAREQTTTPRPARQLSSTAATVISVLITAAAATVVTVALDLILRAMG